MIALEKFREYMANRSETMYGRWKWVEIKQNKNIIQNLPSRINILYCDAVGSFWSGFYTSSILGIVAAIETTLRGLMNSNLSQKSFSQIINKAQQQGLIDTDLKKRIDYFREEARNPLTHDPNVLRIVGMKEKGSQVLDDDRLKLITRLSNEAKDFRPQQKLKRLKAVAMETVAIFSMELLAMDGIETYTMLLEAVKGRKWQNIR